MIGETKLTLVCPEGLPWYAMTQTGKSLSATNLTHPAQTGKEIVLNMVVKQMSPNVYKSAGFRVYIFLCIYSSQAHLMRIPYI